MRRLVWIPVVLVGLLARHWSRSSRLRPRSARRAPSSPTPRPSSWTSSCATSAGDPVAGPDRRRLRDRGRRRAAAGRVGDAVFHARCAAAPAEQPQAGCRRGGRSAEAAERAGAAAGDRARVRPTVARGAVAGAQSRARLRGQGRAQRDHRRLRHRPVADDLSGLHAATRRCSKRRSRRSGIAARRSSIRQLGAATPMPGRWRRQRHEQRSGGVAAGGPAPAAAGAQAGGAAPAAQMAEMARRTMETFDVLERDQQGYATSNSLLALVNSMRTLPGRKSVDLLLRGAGDPAGGRGAVPIGHRHGQPRQRQHLRDGRRRPAHREHEQGDARQHQPGRGAHPRQESHGRRHRHRDDPGAREERGQPAPGPAQRPGRADRRHRRHARSRTPTT